MSRRVPEPPPEESSGFEQIETEVEHLPPGPPPLPRQGSTAPRRHKKPRSHRVRVVVRVSQRGSNPTYWQSVNLSEGGVFVQGAPTAEPGTVIDLRIWIPKETGGSEELDCQARVVWVNKEGQTSAPGLPTGMGMQFLALSDQQRGLLMACVKAQQSRESSSAIAHMIAESLEIAPGQGCAVPAVPPSTPSSRRQAADSSPSPDEDRLPIGAIVGSYAVVELLGEGGMGQVYLVEHLRLGRKFALKRLHPKYIDDTDFVARFFAEARRISQLSHPHIVEVTDFISEGENHCFVMEYLEGDTLDDRLEDNRALNVLEALEIGIQLTDALAVVHAAGILHRDLKPQNVVLVKRSSTPNFVKLLDFGIAKFTDEDGDGSMHQTATGVHLGTPGYMAPEQILGQSCDQRSDIYALGVLLYHVVVGSKPFVAPNWPQMVLMHTTQQPTPPSDVAPGGVPVDLEAVILRCLEKEPDKRPQNMTAVGSELRRIRKELLSEEEDASGRRRTRAWQWLLIVAGLLVLGTGILLTWDFYGPELLARLQSMITAVEEISPDATSDQPGEPAAPPAKTRVGKTAPPDSKAVGGPSLRKTRPSKTDTPKRVRKKRKPSAKPKRSPEPADGLEDLFNQYDR